MLDGRLIQTLQIWIVAEKTMVSGEPNSITTLQDIGNIKTIQGMEQGRYLFSYQFAILLYNTIDTVIDTYPRFAISFNITNTYLRGITSIQI